MQGSAVTLHSFAAPTGGLSGTATLINVANGMDFTVNAEALADLAVRPFYRDYNDPYPDWDAAEVTPVSHFDVNGKQYRMMWSRGVDAVSSVLMRTNIINEYIRDAETRSQTDWLLTFPTRRFYVPSPGTTEPFVGLPLGCSPLKIIPFTREERSITASDCGGLGAPCPTLPGACFAATVLPVTGNDVDAATPVLGSVNRVLGQFLPSNFANGWLSVTFDNNFNQAFGLSSLPTSSVRDVQTDQTQSYALRVFGLPVVGFMVRTLLNGNLSCGSMICQGNYGGALPHKGRRFID